MALINLTGFDHFKTATFSATNSAILVSTLGNLSCGLSAGPGPTMEAQPISQVIQQSGYVGISEVTLSNGKVRKFFTNWSQNGYLRQFYPTTYLNSLPKVGKWVMGCRVYYGSGPTASSPGTVLNMRMGTTPVPAVTVPAPGIYYVETEIDWANQTVKTWLNGVLQNTYSGNAYVNPTYGSIYIYVGAYTNYNVTNFITGYTDLYFAAEETTAEAGTLSRFGPILVKPQPWTRADNMDLFVPTVKPTALEQFNSNNVDLGIVATDYNYGANVVKSSAHGEIGVLTAGTPTETLPIVAVTLSALSHKLSQAAAGTTLQIKQGSAQTTADKTVPGLVGSPTRKTFGLLKALDGSAWSNEKVGQIKFNIGSYRP